MAKTKAQSQVNLYWPHWLIVKKRPIEFFPTPSCAAIVLRGTHWPTDCANNLVHRSPEIKDENKTRLLLVIDPVDNSDE